MTKLFFSYSHRDEEFRDELEIHLATLKRQGVIEAWHDRRLVAGEEFESEISKNLEDAGIVLLLVSPYFIASDYCYDVEMKRAMQLHEEGALRVIPVILQPCDWHFLLFGKLLATPTDGKPVSTFPNQHDAFLEVTQAIRNAAQKIDLSKDRSEETELKDSPVKESLRTSNLRIKKTFTDHEKDAFLDRAFEYISKFFEGSLEELQKRNLEIETRFRRIDAYRFIAAIYANGTLVNSCTIRMEGQSSLINGIAYSAGEKLNNNSFNESLTVDDDGYALSLKPLGIASIGRSVEQQMTYEGGAEYYWSMLIGPLQQG